MDTIGKNANYEVANTLHQLLARLRELSDEIPVFGDYNYLTAFPEFTTFCNNIKSKAIVVYQILFDFYEPDNGLSLLEIPELEKGGDYEIISQLEDFMFAMVESCLSQVDNTDVSEEAVDKLIKDTQERIHFPLISYDSDYKPQVNFSDNVDCMDLNFAPKLRFKHNARKPWINEKISKIPSIFFQDDYMRELGIDPKTQMISIYRNPYSYEIHNIEFPEWEVNGNIHFDLPQSVEETTVCMINTEEGIKELITELKKYNAISVAVIQHSYRSYLGYCSVLMISSPNQDYLIDAIACHNSCHLFNEVFTDPAIVKVMFDSEQMLLWLQRDFGIFMVNLFDIHVAMNFLTKENMGFGKVFKRFIPDKEIHMRYKRADWRTRPLTPEMLLYARKTTHYNLYIYSQVIQLLKEEQQEHVHFVGETLAACNEICLETYHKPVQTYETGEMVIAELGLMLSTVEKMIFLCLYYWRDVVARENDESTQFVLPLLHILKVLIMKPKTIKELDTILTPKSYIVKERLDRLFKIVDKCMHAEDSDIDKLVPARRDYIISYLSGDAHNLLPESYFILSLSLLLTFSRFPQFVQEGCADGSENLQRILKNDRCLFSGIKQQEVSLPQKASSFEELVQYESEENPTNEQLLMILNNRGKFRLLSSSSEEGDKFLVYTSNTLPYNPSAPLRNTVPFIPLRYTDNGITIDPVISSEYINPSVSTFINNMNSTLTEEQKQEHAMIREELQLDHIRSELNHLGSVEEDDAISLTPDAKIMMEKFSKKFNIPIPDGLPPCSLKEIYQLPHKGKGKENEDEEKEDKKKKTPTSGNPSQFNIADILNVSPTDNMTDEEFMKSIGWTEEAAAQAEEESKNILKPFISYSR